MVTNMSGVYEWHEEILEEKFETIIECLGEDGAAVIDVALTENGVRMCELCDGYHGTTLSKAQLDRFIAELQALSDALGKNETSS
ncbi:MAG: hypothetical protein H5U24_19030 [Thioclava marina]|uniref:hypothetical protein n=1 Tax=Thioclava marina TaxID=1915077 RepID=UPI001988EE01|nr:hypothetical protein [Thioclava marina]MBC7147462.1 hypothetical protein [Thioclava marina]